MLRHSLVMQQVVLPSLPPDWPALLDFQLGLNEILLLERVGWKETEVFWQVATTLADPLEGEVLYWGQSKRYLTRPDLFGLRKQIAYISPGQVLLQHLDLGKNIALASSYHQGLRVSQVLAEHGDLLDILGLKPFLDMSPTHLPLNVYWLGIWARELIKGPELVLACLEGPVWLKNNRGVLWEVLEDFIANHEGAFLLAGRELNPFYPKAHRLLRPGAGGFSETRLLQTREKSPVTFFPLV